MKKKGYIIAATAILILIVIAFAVATTLQSIANKSVEQSNDLLPNRSFTDIQSYNDSLSDSKGNRAFTWGIEIWRGTPESYFTKGEVVLTSNSSDNAEVLAIPDPPDKPPVTPGVSYTQSFEVKLDDVQGSHGVRLMYQSFNSSSPIISQAVIIQKVYGKWENGTSGWHTISLTTTPVNGSVVGDVICELWGNGTVYIKNPEFHPTTILDTLSQTNLGFDAVLSVTLAVILIILVPGLLSVMSLVAAPARKRLNEEV